MPHSWIPAKMEIIGFKQIKGISLRTPRHFARDHEEAIILKIVLNEE